MKRYQTSAPLVQPQGTVGPSCVAPAVVPVTVVSAAPRVSVTALARASFAGWHAPAAQVCPAAQAVPQAPQFATLVCTFTQRPLHCVWPAGHTVLHAPALHVDPAPHAWAQLPQFAASVCVFTHAPLHDVRPVGHVHAPAVHVDPVPQAVVQLPQWAASVCVSTHAPPHDVWPVGHTQRPAVQRWPMEHAVVHTPQCALSDVRSTHTCIVPSAHAVRGAAQELVHAPPLHDSPDAQAWPQAPQLPRSLVVSTHAVTQRACPDGHDDGVHVPPMQLSPLAHAWPQAPQCIADVAASMHPPPQSVCPSVHVAAARHAPLEHTWPAAHAVLHAPQFAGSLCVSTHAPPQSDWPAAQLAWHAPAEHVCVAAQAAPHAPQLDTSVVRSKHCVPQAFWPLGHVTGAGPVSCVPVPGTSASSSAGTVELPAQPERSAAHKPQAARALWIMRSKVSPHRRRGRVLAGATGPRHTRRTMQRTLPIASLPSSLRIEDAVEAACAADLAFIDERLRRGVSVLVECEKELSLHLLIALRARLRRSKDAPRMVVIDGRPAADGVPRGSLPRMLEQLTEALRGSVERTLVVLLHLDVLTTTHTGLTVEARESIPLLYENPEAVLLGFRDPSFEIPKVIRGVFGARREVLGTPREALAKLVTQREARALDATGFDPFGLYPYVSGLNPVRLRRVLAELEVRREAPPGRSMAAEVYASIRAQTVSDGVELPNVDLDADIGGYAEVKSRLREELVDLVRRKDTLESEGEVSALETLLPRGVIFHGPPGTGKTYLAKALATALHASVIVVSGPELKSKWVGESEENLRRVFRQARVSAPSVIVFDEIDAFAAERGTFTGSGVEHSMVNQLLTEMDGFRRNEMVFVVATTNRLASVDGALLRPGRFEFLIEVPAPGAEDRAEILAVHAKRLGLALPPEIVAHLVRRTEGLADRDKGLPFSGDHLQSVCRALKRQSLRTGSAVFTLDDIDRALQRKTRRPVALGPDEERVIALHEAGHALLAMVLPRATPPERICVAQDQDGALGYVLRAARARPYVTTDEEMRADICVGLGGQTAERMMLGEASVGAWSDLQRCTALARAMVEEYGMGGAGPRVRLAGDEGRGDACGEARRDRVDAAVDALLGAELARAEQLLAAHRDDLVALWDLLREVKVLADEPLRAFVARVRPAPGG